MRVRFELVGVFLLVCAAVAVAVGGNAPSIMGHSPDEVELRFRTYSTNCSTNAAGVSCTAKCNNASERAIAGNCVTEYGYAYGRFGVTDALGVQQSWECTDNAHDYQGEPYAPYLRAEVVCLRTGN